MCKKQKWYENTIIIITGDTSWHGESLKEAENFNEFIDIGLNTITDCWRSYKEFYCSGGIR